MAKDRDILMKEYADGSVDIDVDVDVKIGDVTLQNMAMMLELEKGDMKQYPTLGVGIGGMVADEDGLYWNREIRETLKSDGMKVETLTVNPSSNDIQINARY